MQHMIRPPRAISTLPDAVAMLVTSSNDKPQQKHGEQTPGDSACNR